MQRIALVTLFLLAFQLIFSQEEKDYHAVMIIPFDPNMYFSDSDEALARYNEKSIKEVRTMFRYGLNVNMNAKILSEYSTRPLLTDTAKGAIEDLYNIYKSISYYQDKSLPNMNLTEEAGTGKPLLTKKKDSGSSNVKNEHTASKLKLADQTKNYINVRIHNPKILAYLRQRYGTELFVFVNQFNLATNYEHCLDRSTNTYERDIKVHFSIFDFTGKQLAGDVAIIKFPSNSNDMTEIMRANFPILSEYMAGNLPNRVKEDKTQQYEKDLQYLKQLEGN